VTGNITGGNLIAVANVIAGAATTYVPSNAPVQAAGTANSYVQMLLQNKSNGLAATTDIVAAADNATDLTTFVSMGINSSTYNQPGYALTTANDAYLYVTGNTTTGGGALVLSTYTAKDIIFSTNGGDTANEIGRFKNGFGLSVVGGVSATGNIQGGNILGGANVNATLLSGTTVSVTGNIDSGNLRTTGLVSATGNITGGNLSGTSIVGTLTTAAQTNITSVGTLTSLAVTGNTTSGNLLTGGLISSTGAVTASQFNGR
jgi:hypothetical protein